MKFVNFKGLTKDKITTDIQVGGINLDLHNEWYFIGYAHLLILQRFTLDWVNEANPDVKCSFDFSGVEFVKVEPGSDDYGLEDAQTVSEILYQECDGLPPTVKFWFHDERTIAIAADSLTLRLDSKSQ